MFCLHFVIGQELPVAGEQDPSGQVLNDFQFSFWSGRCAWRVEAGRNDIFLAAKQIRAAGRVPYLVRAGGDCGGRSRRGRLELKEIQPYCVFAVK